MAGIEDSGATVSRGDILIGGEPIGFEKGTAPAVLVFRPSGATETRMSAQAAVYR
jgi:hypothetical protein